MRIMFFTHYYPPEVNAPASRTAEHARVWARSGHDVVVVTCAPNHPEGRVYPGHRNALYQSETVDGVRVVRVWTCIAANEGVMLRTINYLSYAASASLAMFWLGRPDVVVTTSPQFFCGLIGLVAQTFKRTPWVLEIRDLWPESIVAVGAIRNGVVVRCLEWLERIAYRRADRIVSVTESFVSHISSRCGTPEKISVIKNGADLTRFTPSEGASDVKRRLGLQNCFVAAYVGTHGMAHGLETVLDAAEILRDRPQIAFLLVGDGAARRHLQKIRDEKQLSNVVMLGQQPKEAMPGVWEAIDASLIVLRRDDLFRTVLPSKMFEAMAMRRPIILGVEGEACTLLEEAGAGVAITPESAEELAAAVMRLSQDRELAKRLGAAGYAHVRRHFDRAELAAKYIDVLNDAIATARPGARRRRVALERIADR
ncbi:glycosyltransferase family 4 protein [Methylosinus sporium]|uniref:Glycosyltransferase family 4 protein n=1 Tax=Methylosinus sporium TaxID=428 RepID=A0A549T4N3_METSR|nr:glycosyltransferase family 4 protein [Methylosinus sp. KRF6]TRL36841.1 glycosyltransferase family 4 protein [Methylosinus sporium]